LVRVVLVLQVLLVLQEATQYFLLLHQLVVVLVQHLVLLVQVVLVVAVQPQALVLQVKATQVALVKQAVAVRVA
jgi:hypothetical protein